MKFFFNIKIALAFLCYPFILKSKRNVSFGKRLKVRGWPNIDIRNYNKLTIGSNVTLNSSNYRYHINMFKPVKILLDGINSEVSIGSNTRIHGSCIHAKSKIIIGANCLIAANCHIIDSNGHETAMGDPASRLVSVDIPKDIFIGDNVWIGANSIVLKGVTIGNGSIVAAGSVVVKDVPPNTIVGGNPAKILNKKVQE